MQDTDTPVSPEIVALIDRTIREAMAPYRPRSVHVRAGEDHDGDPVIFVEVDYDLTETPVDLAAASRIRTPLLEKMWDAGERRFPHFRHRFHERQPDSRKRA
jgi:hypothetical protein